MPDSGCPGVVISDIRPICKSTARSPLSIWGTATSKPGHSKQLLERVERMASRLEAVTQAMGLLDDHDRLVACNLALEELTGVDRSELIGKSPVDLVAPESRSVVRRQLSEQRKGDAPPCNLLLSSRDGKELWVRKAVTPLFDRTGDFVGSICTLYPLGADGVAQGELTAREREIQALLIRGLSRAEIASQLSIAENTVRNHVKSIYRKLDVHSQAQLMSRRRTER